MQVIKGMKTNTRWPSLIVLCIGFLLIVVDMTIVNVALPSIQRDLQFTQAGLAWVVNAYLIAFGGLLLLAGRLGDLFGRRRTFLIGLAIFIGASVLCGLSFNQAMLIAARFVQGIGGAVTAVAAARLLANDRGLGVSRGADVLGALLVTGSLMLAVYTIAESSVYGLASTHTLVTGSISLVLLGAFIARQAMASNPILPLRLFASRRLAASNAVQALMSSAFFGFFFLGSLDLERVLGYGPMAIGLAFLPVAAVMAAFSIRFSAQLIGRFGPVAVLAVGQGVAAVSLAMLALGPTDASYAIHFLFPLALLGLGGGLSFPALTIIAMSGVSPADAGMASGVLNTTGQVGGALGLAVLATLAGWRTLSLAGDGAATAVALAGGYHLAWLAGAGAVIATLTLVVTVLRVRQPAAVEMPNADCCEAAA